MKATTINRIKPGTYFKLSPTDSAPVWVRDKFVISASRFSCHKFDDVNHEKLMRGSQTVYVDFEF